MGEEWDENAHPRAGNGRFVSQEIAALRREQTLIWNAHAREHEQHETAHSREHAFAQDAIDKAALMARENKADANEWRGTMNDREEKFSTKVDLETLTKQVDQLDVRAQSFLTIAEYSAKHESLLNRILSMEQYRLVTEERERTQTTIEAESKRQDERRQTRDQWVVGIIIGVVVLIINLLLRLASGS